MCFDHAARPPSAPRSGYLETSQRLTLEAADGNRFAATLATTRGEGAPAVVILPDVRGLHRYYELLAEELAGAGAHALALDFYGRSAGAAHRGEDFDFGPHRAALTDDGLRADVAAAIERTRSTGADRTFVVGFCVGGRGAFMQASRDDVAGVIGFYGWPAREWEGSSPITEAQRGRTKAPVLALYGGADKNITTEDIAAYDSALERAGVPHESVIYPGAPHSFFDRKMQEHEDACADAWRRMLDFVGL